jgi:hypothetical protein
MTNRIPNLRQAPEAAVHVEEQAGVAEDLELLADFIGDVAVVGVEFGELVGEGVGVAIRKLRFVEAADGGEDVQGPAAVLKGKVFERFDALKLVADVGGRRYECYRSASFLGRSGFREPGR